MKTQIELLNEDPLRKNRRYLFLVSAQAVSNFGDWLYILALLVLVGVHWHASPASIAIMMLCLSGPMIILGPFTGVLADRLNRTGIMMTSNLVMAILVGLIPSVHKLWILFCLLIAIGSFESVFNPAEQGKLKEVVSDAHMQQATAINTAINQIAKVIGPSLSGLLVAAFGAMSAFYLDSASFVISTVLLVFTGKLAITAKSSRIEKGTTATETITETATDTFDTLTSEGEALELQSSYTKTLVQEKVQENSNPTQETFLARFRVGWAHILKRRFLLVGLLLLSVILLIIQLTDSQWVTLLRLVPTFSPNLFGYLMAAAGAGTLLAALVIGRIKSVSPILMMGLGTLLLACGFGGIAFVVDFRWYWWLIPLLALAAGAGAGMVFIPFQAAAQRETPVELTGRVFGVIGSFTTGASLLGPVVGGLLVSFYGAVDGFLVTATALAILAVAVVILKHWLEPRDELGTESNGTIQETTTL